MVASLPVTPAPAVAGPFTGGQNVAHEPLHFDVVAVSGTNQYKVRPLALVTTVAPPILVVFSALLPAAGALEAGVVLEAAPPELVELDELLQAAITKAAARPAGTSHTLFITYPRLPAQDRRRLPDLELHSCPPTCSPAPASSLGRLRLSHQRLCRRWLAAGWRGAQTKSCARRSGQASRAGSHNGPTPQASPPGSEITRRPRNQNRPNSAGSQARDTRNSR